MTANDPIRYGASYKSTTALAANTSEAVFAAGSNTNGAIVWHADAITVTGVSSNAMAWAAHTAAPNSVTVGDVLASNNNSTVVAGVTNTHARLNRPVFVPAGKGFYFTSAVGESSAYRSASYTLL